MSIRTSPYYWLECDAPGCGANSTEGDDYTAYGTEEGAKEQAQDAEWKLIEDGRHYCYEHAMYVCMECGALDLTELAGERDYLCVSCFSKTREVEEVASP